MPRTGIRGAYERIRRQKPWWDQQRLKDVRGARKLDQRRKHAANVMLASMILLFICLAMVITIQRGVR